jgi:serine/threonine-protein kinase
MSEPLDRPPETTVDLKLADVLEGYRRQLNEGLDPDPEACLAAHPEMTPELADCLEGLAAIEELRTAVESGPEAAPFQPRTLGGFELLREVGRGGMGVVYEARHVRLGRRVALKMVKAGDLASPQELERFRAEALAVACLQHPNIVQIYEVGELEGRPYLALEFVDGRSLDEQLAGTPLPVGPGAELVETLARAMHCAHEQKIVHRDLKPGNVLLAHPSPPTPLPEAERGGHAAPAGSPLSPSGRGVGGEGLGVPKITDFGLAKRLDSVLGQTHSGDIVGTPAYMAPEQAAGKTRQISPATDIYALGVILYETLTGRPPFQAETPWDTLAQVISQEPVPPSRLQPKIPRDLETICLKCLQKEPARRYGSSLALADDLRRFLDGEPIHARPVGAAERLWRWCRRHPGLAGFLVTAALLLVSVTVAAVSVAQARAARLQQEVLRSNLYAARGVASTVLWQLDLLSEPVVRTAEDPTLQELLSRDDRRGLQKFIDKTHRQYADPANGFAQPGGESAFQSWHVLDRRGILRADSSTSEDVRGHPFSRRDYFQGAMRRVGQTGRASVYISRVYLSRNDNIHKISITVPVRAGPDPRSRVVGVLSATLTTTSTLGSLRLNDARRTAVLVGRRDTNPLTGPLPAHPPGEYLILLHPAYHRGEGAIQVSSDRLRAIHQPRPGSMFRLPDAGRAVEDELAMDPDYRDPLAEHNTRYQGRWLAGFAPVGNTELVVIVQQRYDEVIDFDLVWAAAAVALGVLLVAGVAWYAVQRTLNRRSRRGWAAA